MEIKVINYRAMDGSTPTQGYADVVLEDESTAITIRGVALVKNSKDEFFVRMPQKSYQKDGKTEYSPLVTIKSKEGATENLPVALLGELVSASIHVDD